MKQYVLGIDTSKAETAIGVAGEGLRKVETWTSVRNQSKELLSNIDKLLGSQKIKPQGLKWVVVNLGPGSFTGLRVGISIANAFGYGLNIPVIGKAKLAGSATERMEQLLGLTTKAQVFKQVLPSYGRPARITKPKKKD